MHKRPSRMRRGFTLIELLVVMAIISLLVSLLMPAVQRAREASRRTSCQNNLHQIVVALTNYESMHRSFPSGFIDDQFAGTSDVRIDFPGDPITLSTGPNTPPTLIDYWQFSSTWGWHALVLSQMDQQTVNVDFLFPKIDLNNQEAMRVPIETYVCPSMRLPTARPDGFGYTNYRGSLGSRIANATGGPDINLPGMFTRNQGVKTRDVADGSSHTLFVGESIAGFWGDGYSCCARVRYDRPYFDGYWDDQAGIHYFGFGSWHEQVSHFAMVDGSVRPIAKNIDSNLLHSLATRSGDERISVEY